MSSQSTLFGYLKAAEGKRGAEETREGERQSKRTEVEKDGLIQQKLERYRETRWAKMILHAPASMDLFYLYNLAQDFMEYIEKVSDVDTTSSSVKEEPSVPVKQQDAACIGTVAFLAPRTKATITTSDKALLIQSTGKKRWEASLAFDSIASLTLLSIPNKRFIALHVSTPVDPQECGKAPLSTLLMQLSSDKEAEMYLKALATATAAPINRPKEGTAPLQCVSGVDSGYLLETESHHVFLPRPFLVLEKSKVHSVTVKEPSTASCRYTSLCIQETNGTVHEFGSISRTDLDPTSIDTTSDSYSSLDEEYEPESQDSSDFDSTASGAICSDSDGSSVGTDSE